MVHDWSSNSVDDVQVEPPSHADPTNVCTQSPLGGSMVPRLSSKTFPTRSALSLSRNNKPIISHPDHTNVSEGCWYKTGGEALFSKIPRENHSRKHVRTLNAREKKALAARMPVGTLTRDACSTGQIEEQKHFQYCLRRETRHACELVFETEHVEPTESLETIVTFIEH